MDVRVSGHQVETGDALKAHVEDRLNAIAQKYFSRAIAATVTFGTGPHQNGFVCDIVAHVMQGLILKATGQETEAHPAFDRAADRIETQLRRYMRRLKDRSGAPATSAEVDTNAGYTVFQEQAAVEDEPAENPVVIAETRVDVPDASVSDAVMMLDLRNTNALLFRNAGSGSLNMVYRRGDGTIGWVEPSRTG
jgi:ribosomal subunit interface protein